VEANLRNEGTEDNGSFPGRSDSLSELHLANHSYLPLPFITVLLVTEGLERVLSRYLVLYEVQVADWDDQKSGA